MASCTPRRFLTVLIATAAALAHWALLDLVAGADLVARTGGSERPVGAAMVAAGSLAAGLAAWGLLALLERVADRARLIWTVIAGAVLVLSLAGPLGGAVGAGNAAALAGLHLTVGAALIAGLPRRGRAAC
ncbi:DUF6069 family protein [Actinomadura sp. 21ATH]|uniref:DUF6069 family protein n=1 Tax=Actinomadura sp. 21ATH TaxID=1735444 RepID=UPI0035C25628